MKRKIEIDKNELRTDLYDAISQLCKKHCLVPPTTLGTIRFTPDSVHIPSFTAFAPSKDEGDERNGGNETAEAADLVVSCFAPAAPAFSGKVLHDGVYEWDRILRKENGRLQICGRMQSTLVVLENGVLQIGSGEFLGQNLRHYCPRTNLYFPSEGSVRGIRVITQIE